MPPAKTFEPVHPWPSTPHRLTFDVTDIPPAVTVTMVRADGTRSRLVPDLVAIPGGVRVTVAPPEGGWPSDANLEIVPDADAVRRAVEEAAFELYGVGHGEATGPGVLGRADARFVSEAMSGPMFPMAWADVDRIHQLHGIVFPRGAAPALPDCADDDTPLPDDDDDD